MQAVTVGQGVPKMAQLVVESSPDSEAAGIRVELDAGRTDIGRDLSNTLVLADPGVSRRHARLEGATGGHVLHDLGAANGTFVNGKRITDHTLRHGDRIRIGGSELRFEDLRGAAGLAAAELIAVTPPEAPPVPPPHAVPAGGPAGVEGAPPPPPPWLGPPPMAVPPAAPPPPIAAAPPQVAPPVPPPLTAGRRRRWPWVAAAVTVTAAGIAGVVVVLVLVMTGSGPVPATGSLEIAELIAEGEVGPEGGRIEADGVIALEFPPGALAQSETISIRRVEGSPVKGVLVSVSVSGDGVLARPVRVVQQLPPEVDLDSAVAVHEAGFGWLYTIPSDIDRGSRTLAAEVRHFSLMGWVELASYRTWISVGGGAVGGLATGTVLVLVGTTTGTLPFVLVVAGIAAGAAAANPVWDAVEREGFDAHLPAAGFNISWVRGDLEKLPTIAVIVDGTGAMTTIVPFKGAGHGGPGMIDWSSIKDKGEFMSCRVAYQVPESILSLAGALQYIRVRYAAEGYRTPDNLTVLITDDVGKSDWGGDQNFGKWDGANLRISADVVRAMGQGRADSKKVASLLGTAAHEYWHAIWATNDFSETLSGLDECLATSYESVIFPSLTEYSELRKWSDAVPVLVNGLLEAGSGEGYTRECNRGYALWTWGKWLIHTQGGAVITELADGEMPDDTRAALFAAFARALLVEELGLRKTEDVSLPGGATAASTTGWDTIDLDAMAMKKDDRMWSLGRNELPEPGPMSISLVKVILAESTGTSSAAPLVVRREEPDPEEELIALRPVSGRIMVSRVPTLDDITIGRGGVAVDAAWLATTQKNLALPVAVVISGSSSASGGSSPFVAYRLAPPRTVTATRQPQANGVELGWDAAGPDGGLDLTDCIAGYRILGAIQDGSERVLAEAILDLGYFSTPNGWYASTAKHVFKIGALDRSLTLPGDVVGSGVVRVGIASLEGQMRRGADALMSPVTWSSPLEPGAEPPPLKGPFEISLTALDAPGDAECSPPREGIALGVGFQYQKVVLDDAGAFEVVIGDPGSAPTLVVRGRASSGLLELSGTTSSSHESGSARLAYLPYSKSTTSCAISGASPLEYSEPAGLRVFRTTKPIVALCTADILVRAGGTFSWGNSDEQAQTDRERDYEGSCRGEVRLEVTLSPSPG